MSPLAIASTCLLTLSLAGVLLVFVVNPLLLWVVSRFHKPAGDRVAAVPPLSVSVIIVAHNAGAEIETKLGDTLRLAFPSPDHDIIFFSDGSTDDTVARAQKYAGDRVQVHFVNEHHGKINCLNAAVAKSSKEILVFSDVDTCLDPQALLTLVAHFTQTDVGGVCGRKVIARTADGFKQAQKVYGGFDYTIKKWESRIGCISANDGNLYAIRRALFRPIPEAVTDDFYVCLAIVQQGRRFLYTPAATAAIEAQSRNPAHEVQRRRRIVPQSLQALRLMAGLMNPFRHGYFAVRLFVNKVLRRCLPFFLIGLFLASAVLAWTVPRLLPVLLGQAAFYGLALSYPLVFRHLPGWQRGGKIAATAYYFCIGNYGTLLGVCDFLRGRQVSKWTPYAKTE